jgi:hypothetical protein
LVVVVGVVGTPGGRTVFFEEGGSDGKGGTVDGSDSPVSCVVTVGVLVVVVAAVVGEGGPSWPPSAVQPESAARTTLASATPIAADPRARMAPDTPCAVPVGAVPERFFLTWVIRSLCGTERLQELG